MSSFAFKGVFSIFTSAFLSFSGVAVLKSSLDKETVAAGLRALDYSLIEDLSVSDRIAFYKKKFKEHKGSIESSLDYKLVNFSEDQGVDFLRDWCSDFLKDMWVSRNSSRIFKEAAWCTKSLEDMMGVDSEKLELAKMKNNFDSYKDAILKRIPYLKDKDEDTIKYELLRWCKWKLKKPYSLYYKDLMNSIRLWCSV
ncbi:hypothetical protein MHC_02200 [Mycoplasma haemocanis str. Illinois]|uniref:Uncharacterized protein n=1 Tax=Mycoplasma haemocanis (strain Illinois) TaxID=1111676 RepID=H6N6N4_MYCHN|nr:hypothetical protein [Mycoplasma haemocanis]AEW45306.1 hypothetical protein MHC_02200 [Mycoplasma haemocanis str. Illinois]